MLEKKREISVILKIQQLGQSLENKGSEKNEYIYSLVDT
jgi:hypothetical protein